MSTPEPPVPTPLTARDDREAWRALVEYLQENVPACQRPADLEGVVDRLVRRHPRRDRAGRAAAMEDLADQLGLSVTWRTARMRDVSQLVVPDEIAVAWSEDGWVAVRRPRLRPVVERGPWGVDPEGLTVWASVASAWPASSLAAGPGVSHWRRLGRLLMAERRDLGLIIAYGVAASLLALAVPVAVQVLVNTIAFGAFRQPLLVLTLLLFAALSLAAFLVVLQRIVVETLQRRLMARVTDDLSVRLPRVRVRTFDAASGPELVNRFFDVITVQKSLAILLLDGLAASVSAVVGLSLLAVYHPALLGFDIVLILAVVVVLFGLGQGGPEAAVVESKRKYKLAEWLEIVSARPDVFKHDGAGALAARRSASATRDWLQARDRHFRIFLSQIGGAYALRAVALTALLGIGGWLVLDGQLTLGQLVAAEIVVASALTGLVGFAGKLETLYDLLAAVDKLGHLLDLPLDPAGPSGAGRDDVPVGLCIDAVSVPRRAEPVAFTVDAGETVAVGVRDAVARRHLADLLVLARDPASGRMRFDGIDACDVSRNTVQDRAVLVRDPHPLPATLRENLQLGREDLDDDDLRESLAAVGLEGLPARLGAGLDADLVPNDTRFGHEDLVRLAIARAIVGRPRLIVVDGVLDTIEGPARDHLLSVLTAPDRCWTLVLLDDDADDATPRPLGPGPAHRAA